MARLFSSPVQFTISGCLQPSKRSKILLHGKLSKDFNSRESKTFSLISHVFQKTILKDLFFLSLTPKDIEAKYSGVYAISRLAVSIPRLLASFKKINQEKTWDQQIKPFNFYTLGFQTIEKDGKAVKPLVTFSSNPQEIVYEPFIDYETGEFKEGSHYFKALSKDIYKYHDLRY